LQALGAENSPVIQRVTRPNYAAVNEGEGAQSV
jgi:hypothetical protein